MEAELMAVILIGLKNYLIVAVKTFATFFANKFILRFSSFQ